MYIHNTHVYVQIKFLKLASLAKCKKVTQCSTYLHQVLHKVLRQEEDTAAGVRLHLEMSCSQEDQTHNVKLL